MRNGRGIASKRSVLKAKLLRNGKSLEDWKRRRDRFRQWNWLEHYGRNASRPLRRHRPGGRRRGGSKRNR